MSLELAKKSAISTTNQELYDQVDMTRFFGVGNANGERLLSGWAPPEQNQNWNDGSEVAYLLNVSPAPREACIIRVEGVPFIHNHVPRQTVAMYVNGLRLGGWSFHAPSRVVIEARVEPEQWLIRNGVAVGRVSWHIPHSVSPHQLGIGSDERELGFCFVSITVASA
jgi:hypothetical protein